MTSDIERIERYAQQNNIGYEQGTEIAIQDDLGDELEQLSEWEKLKIEIRATESYRRMQNNEWFE